MNLKELSVEQLNKILNDLLFAEIGMTGGFTESAIQELQEQVEAELESRHA